MEEFVFGGDIESVLLVVVIEVDLGKIVLYFWGEIVEELYKICCSKWYFDSLKIM